MSATRLVLLTRPLGISNLQAANRKKDRKYITRMERYENGTMTFHNKAQSNTKLPIVFVFSRSTEREYSSKPLKLCILKRILVFKR